MSKLYRTARGVMVDFDALRLANENTIAIGNTNTNARGDELGPGGKIVKTRAQIMQEYHALNKPTATHDDVISEHMAEVETAPSAPVSAPQPKVEKPVVSSPTAVEQPVTETAFTKPRGSFADSIAKETEVTQELLDPVSILRGSPPGVTRI